MASSSRTGGLSESAIQDAFHSYLKSSLSQAKAEHLLDSDVLSSAEADVMVTGPALCLYFSALRCTTNPPSVPLPRSKSGGEPMDLSTDNCPPTFLPFLRAWSSLVPRVQSMSPEMQHDLARVICGLPPLQFPDVGDVAHAMRAVALEIGQRRTFQLRYGGDLQAALDGAGDTGGGIRKTASFVPPPSYEETPVSPMSAQFPGSTVELQPPVEEATYGSRHTRTFSSSSMASTASRSPSPLHLQALEMIRETLYASLADVLSMNAAALRPLLHSDPPRAYYASVSLAVLEVSLNSLEWSDDGSSPTGVRGVLGATLTLDDCPIPLRPFMKELCALGVEARLWRTKDDEAAVDALTHNKRPGEPQLDRVRTFLIKGAYDLDKEEDGSRRRSVEGRTLALANRVGALSLGMTRLRAFRERQDEVFGILRAVMSD